MNTKNSMRTGQKRKQWYSTILPGLAGEKVFRVADIARMMEVDKHHIYKLIDAGIISREEWFKLPNGYIRIRASVVKRINTGEL